MDFDQASLDFLEHFDQPKTADDDPPDPVAGFVCDEQGRIKFPEQSRTDSPGVSRLERSEPPLNWDLIDALPDRPTYTRGIGWVLLWSGALAVLVVAASMLAQVGYLITAEHSLNIAVRAAAMEATLPRSNYQSIVATVNRRLENRPQLAGHLTLTVLQNGFPVLDKFQAHEGDEFSIALSAPSSYAIPDWLEKISVWRSPQNVNAEATCRLPSRKLPPRTH
jgi:hypothetical protein